MTNRALAEKELLYFVELFLPGSENRQLYVDLLKDMDDKAFAAWMDKLATGDEILAIYAPNLHHVVPTIPQAYVVADALGFELFQHLILTDQHTGQVYRTQNKHLIGLVPLRRQVQMLEKKRSIPGSMSTADERSGQAAGGAKSARMSGPEIQVNASKGLTQMLVELVKFRAGDERSYNAMNKSILETGRCSLDAIMSDNPGMVKANKTLSVYLTSMLLENNMLKE
jgi:hypothetical protein